MLRLVVVVRALENLFDKLQVFAQCHDHFGSLAETLEVLLLVRCEILPELGSEVRDTLVEYLILPESLSLEDEHFLRVLLPKRLLNFMFAGCFNFIILLVFQRLSPGHLGSLLDQGFDF